MKKAVDLFTIITFVLFAIVQWNDPDPGLWILCYLLVALIPLSHLLGFRCRKCELVFGIILGVVLASYVPSLFQWFQDGMPTITSEMKATTPYIEYVREALGLLISLLVVGLYWRKR